MNQGWYLPVFMIAIFLVCGCEHNHRHGATYDAGDFAYDSLELTGQTLSAPGEIIYAAMFIPAIPFVLLEQGLSPSSKQGGPTFQQAYNQPTSPYFAERKSALRPVRTSRKVKAGDRVWKID